MTKSVKRTGSEKGPSGARLLLGFVWAGAFAVWLVPVVAQGVSPEMNWSFGDFALFAALLAVLAGTATALLRSAQSKAHRVGLMLAVATAVLCFLANGAVGLVGSEADWANSPFTFLAMAVVVGCMANRHAPKRLAALIGAAAVLHITWALAIPTFGLIAGAEHYWRDAVLASLSFGGLWLAAALMVRKA